LAIASLIIGILCLPTVGIVGVGAILAIVLGIVALVKIKNEPQAYGGKGLAIGGIVTGGLSILIIPVILIVAAIAIPSLLRARVSANEAGAIGDVRTVISAQVAYASANGEYFDTLECLAAPQQCIPSYPAGSPVFLDQMFVQSGVKAGYQRNLHAGPAPFDLDPTRVSRSSMTAFAYVAVPIQQGRTGIRAFCGDSTGVVCHTADGRMPPIVDGQCPPPDVCIPLH
jgi:type IV pilus assembly protein PilA